MLMSIMLFLISLVLPSSNSRFVSLLHVIISVLLGAVVYFGYMWYSKAMNRVFGERINKYLKKYKKV